MQWLELTSEQMPAAVERADGVCLLPMGCVERHGPHLPLGTDQIVADAVARRAAETEPAVVFPPYYLGQIAEARHKPGTVSLPHDLLYQALRATLGEIARNGFGRIIIVNAHGGNRGLLSYVLFSLLQEPCDYIPYVHSVGHLLEDDREQWEDMEVAEEGGHAGERETSLLLHLRPEAVRMEDVTGPEDWSSRESQAGLGGLQNPFSWYARYPSHFAGDPTHAGAEKGEFLFGACVRALAEAIRAVKADRTTPMLQQEFYDAGRDPLG
ncbi:MAG: creatininase family protein [Candidatus Brocadiia bacterium]